MKIGDIRKIGTKENPIWAPDGEMAVFSKPDKDDPRCVVKISLCKIQPDDDVQSKDSLLLGFASIHRATDFAQELIDFLQSNDNQSTS